MPAEELRGEVDELVAAVPELPRFLSAAEIDNEASELARRHQGIVRLRRIGHSANGDQLLMMEVGDGPHTALWVGAPHPNEPVGTLTTLHLARALAEHPEVLRRLKARFLLIPVIDRDGYRLNEGWITATGFSFTRYARNYYRPPARMQVEWSFPYFSHEFDFSATPPETRALQHVIERHPPRVLFSLHNTNVGGVFYYLNRSVPGLEAALVDYPSKVDLPLEPAMPEEPWGRTLSPFVLESLSVHGAVEYLLAHGLDPRKVLQHGAGSIEFASSLNPGLIGLMAEVPLFADARVAESSTAPVDRTSMEAERHASRERVVNLLRSAYQTLAREGVLREGIFRRGLENALEFQVRREGLAPAPSPDGPVTVSELFRSQIVARFLDLRLLGLLYRFIHEQAVPGTFAREGLLRSTDDQMAHVARGLEANLKGKRAPVQHLVRTQMSAGLQALRFVG